MGRSLGSGERPGGGLAREPVGRHRLAAAGFARPRDDDQRPAQHLGRAVEPALHDVGRLRAGRRSDEAELQQPFQHAHAPRCGVEQVRERRNEHLAGLYQVAASDEQLRGLHALPAVDSGPAQRVYLGADGVSRGQLRPAVALQHRYGDLSRRRGRSRNGRADAGEGESLQLAEPQPAVGHGAQLERKRAVPGVGQRLHEHQDHEGPGLPHGQQRDGALQHA